MSKYNTKKSRQKNNSGKYPNETSDLIRELKAAEKRGNRMAPAGAKLTKRNVKRDVAIGVGVLVACFIIFFCTNILPYAAATEDATQKAQVTCSLDQVGNGSPDQVAVSQTNDGFKVFQPADGSATTGIVFYPTASVDEAAYAPLMQDLAQKGYLCVLCSFPFHIAFFTPHVADGVPQQFPQITTWYMAGHGLGGSMACTHANDNTNTYAGVILLASYTSVDLSKTELRALTVYGSEDGVLNRNNYTKNLANLPEGYTEKIIEGGNYTQFGSYPLVHNDNEATISADQQQEETARLIDDFIKGR